MELFFFYISPTHARPSLSLSLSLTHTHKFSHFLTEAQKRERGARNRTFSLPIGTLSKQTNERKKEAPHSLLETLVETCCRPNPYQNLKQNLWKRIRAVLLFVIYIESDCSYCADDPIIKFGRSKVSNVNTFGISIFLWPRKSVNVFKC